MSISLQGALAWSRERLNELDPLWAHVRAVWSTEIVALTVGQLVGAALILALSVLLRGVLGRIILAIGRRVTARTKTEWDDRVDCCRFSGRPPKLTPPVARTQLG